MAGVTINEKKKRVKKSGLMKKEELKKDSVPMLEALAPESHSGKSFLLKKLSAIREKGG